MNVWRVLSIVTYSYSAKDTLINATVLACQLAALAVVSSRRRLSLSSIFWLPFAFFICTLQILVCVITGDEGFSILWCTLAGLMVYEHAVHDAFSIPGNETSAALVLAIVSYTLVAIAVICYAIKEAYIASKQKVSDCEERNRSRLRKALTAYWLWCGATSMHLLAILIGVGLVALVDLEDERRVGFFAILAAGVMLVFLLPIACHSSSSTTQIHPSISAHEVGAFL